MHNVCNPRYDQASLWRRQFHGNDLRSNGHAVIGKGPFQGSAAQCGAGGYITGSRRYLTSHRDGLCRCQDGILWYESRDPDLYQTGSGMIYLKRNPPSFPDTVAWIRKVKTGDQGYRAGQVCDRLS